MIDYRIIMGALGGVTLASMAGSVLLARRVRRLSLQVLELRNVRTEVRDPVQPPAGRNTPAVVGDFAPVLEKSQLRSRLQERGPLRAPPERYLHVVSLMEHGMNAAQIAEILHLAPEETAQLVALARTGRRENRDLTDTARFKREARELIAKDFSEFRRNSIQTNQASTQER